VGIRCRAANEHVGQRRVLLFYWPDRASGLRPTASGDLVGAYIFLIALKTAIDVAFQVGGDTIKDWLEAKAKAAAKPQG
jgi:hypothetical protein